MNDETLNAFQVLETLKTDPRFQGVPILAFAKHEEVETWNRARLMGVTKIVSRNEFSARTRGLIEDIMAAPGSGRQAADRPSDEDGTRVGPERTQ